MIFQDMLKGIVKKVLLDYLGRYFKGFEKDFKVGVWNAGVSLENLELVLEAFDYLQLPLALKQGRVGKLRINIPWKRLGRVPITIELEDVFVSVAKRDDHEWSMNLVERREISWKRAKLAAAELAKLSRRVSDNQAGRSFISYITAKILDNIQVSIKNVHIVYMENERNPEQVVFGVRVSSVITKDKLLGPDRKVEISGLGIYCSTFGGSISREKSIGASQLYTDAILGRNELDYILAPFDTSISLVVNRSGKLDSGVPQYSVSAQLSDPVLALNELQMQQLFILWDYLSTSQLREKYWRYRPWCSLLSRKLSGWQRMWWQYAQESVLLDVRRKLKKSSWRHLGWRINYRRQYVNLYKKKLDFLRQNQAVDEDILQELEKMEKETDLDDILSYRSIAEHESEMFHSSSTQIKIDNEKDNENSQKNDSHSSVASRGWLNWLSRGMLGAAGTEDSVQFSGIVSDEVIQDIYEVTKFHPDSSLDEGIATKERNYISLFKFSIHQITATLRSKTLDKDTIQLTCGDVVVECKFWEDSWAINAMVKSTEIAEASGLSVILRTFNKDDSLKCTQPFITLQVETTPVDTDFELLLKVLVQPFEITYNPESISNLLDFNGALSPFQFQRERVLLAVNNFENDNARLQSKIEYILSNRKHLKVDVLLNDFTIKFPWRHEDSDLMLVNVGSLIFKSKETEAHELDTSVEHSDFYSHIQTSTSTHGLPLRFQLQDLYDQLEISITDFEVNVLKTKFSETVSVLERFSGSMNLSSCIIPRESILKQLKIDFSLSSLHIHLSPQISAVMEGVIKSLDIPALKPQNTVEARISDVFNCSIAGSMDSLHFNAGDAETNLVLFLALGGVEIQFFLEEEIEYWVQIKMLKLSTCIASGENNTLCISRNFVPLDRYQHDMGPRIDIPTNYSADGSFLLHYVPQRSSGMACHKFAICFHDMDLHVYPKIFGPLLEFYDKFFRDVSPKSDESDKLCGFNKEFEGSVGASCFGRRTFGYSNYIESQFVGLSSIPLNQFPFVTITNSGSLSSLAASLIHVNPGWRKLFVVSDKKFGRSMESNVRKRSRIVSSRTKKFHLSTSVSESCIDMEACGICIHFHDSSCILCLITLPILNSYIVLDGNNSLDFLLSVEGLSLTSSWSTSNFELLWGPSDPNLSNILNLRWREKYAGSSCPQFELSISVQHTCCVLPSEFLAILIGYFSSPDWTSGQKEHHGSDGNTINILYKFEILDSVLILPLESNNNHSLHLKLPQLYCTFTKVNNLYDVVKDIPDECVVPPSKLVKNMNMLNIFGLSLSLFHVYLKDENVEGEDKYIHPLLADVDTDLWLRIPCGNSAPTCIMTRINNCCVIVEDKYIFSGVEAVVEVIIDMSSVGRDSEAFTSDVLQFRQTKLSLKEAHSASSYVTSVALTEVSCGVNSLSITLYCTDEHSCTSDKVAGVDIQLQFSATFRDEIPKYVDIEFSGFKLYSFRTSVSLLQSITEDSGTSPLDVHFSKSEQGQNLILIGMASFYIWSHLSELSEVCNLLSSCSKHWSGISAMNGSSKALTSGTTDVEINYETSVVPSSDTVDFNLKLDYVVVSFHIPTVAVDAASEKLTEAEGFYTDIVVHETILRDKCCKYVLVKLKCRNTEIVIRGTHVKLTSNLEKIRATLETVESERNISLPFFQLVHVNMLVEMCDNHHLQQFSTKIQIGSMDIWLSHQIFYFWHGIEVKMAKAEAGDSQYPFSSMVFDVQATKFSLLLTDRRWTWNGHLLEILVRNLLLYVHLTESTMNILVGGDLLVNYNNIHKVMWEPFIEPWKFQAELVRKSMFSPVMNISTSTHVSLKSIAQLNLNITEPLIEAVFRANELIRNVWGQNVEVNISATQSLSEAIDNVYARRSAPYTLQNDTSLPLLFQVYRSIVNANNQDIPVLKEGTIVQPGSSIPIYVDEIPDEEVFWFKQPQSSDSLNEKSAGVAQYMISIELDGTSGPSVPISMDFVGLSYFEVNFSKASEKLMVNKGENDSKYNRQFQEICIDDSKRGFVVPVVFDVSIQHFTKLIRLYSTVILLNATSMPLELRFDIPFGVSPKVLDPIYPGKEFPLPVHLAKAGRMRWRPVGDNFLWSEVHLLSNLLSPGNGLGFLRSFVCYPSHPNSDPFRCCISVQHIDVPSSSLVNPERSLEHHIHYLTLTTPLMIRNFLPMDILVTVESGEFSQSVILPEVETASVFYIDSTHDLGIMFNIDGFRPSGSKFPRKEAFTAIARLNDGKLFSSETLAFYSNSSKGPIYITLEKVMDASCGAREIFISVPFLLYNCTGLPLTVINSSHDTDGKNFCTVSSCYNLVGSEQYLARKSGLSLVSDDHELSTSSKRSHYRSNSLSNPSAISLQESSNLYSLRSLSNHNIVSASNQYLCQKGVSVLRVPENETRKAKACMYSPDHSSSSSELMVKLNMSLPENIIDSFTSSSWSDPFFLVPASGSASVVVPKTHSNGAFILSVTSSQITGPCFTKTRSVTFQPRYVISNACSKELCYKQKGTDTILRLGVGQHSHLHWADTSRKLLVSLRFKEPGWLWSGAFFPDHLGDTQVKMRNYVASSLSMIRVEVQNADVSIKGEKIVGNAHGNSGTNLILLSDDTSGFMPYRIDNFSKERLRIYQKSCETSETTVHSYTSCPYAWDEPCYPHRLVLEVPGQRVLGSYSLDEVMEQVPLNLPSTLEKPGRSLFLSIHAEGAVKVLSVIDPSCHTVKNITGSGSRGLKYKETLDQNHDATAEYSEKLSVFISFVGVSFFNSNLQELLFASAKDVKIEVLQNLEQQRLSITVSSLQIDNQLQNATYPVILHFDPESESRSNSASPQNLKDGNQRTSEPVLSLSATKWRNKDISLVSFEHISLRLADLCLELEEELILSLLHLVRVVTSKIGNRCSPSVDSALPATRVYESVNVSRNKSYSINDSSFVSGTEERPAMAAVIPIGAPWQKIYLLAKRQRKIYVEILDLAPIKVTLSFSSTPWVSRNEGVTSAESFGRVNGTALQRGLMAFADIEGAPVYLRQLSIAHHLGSFESYQEILIRHYTRELLHETYKVFGSAGVMGNPMGFARNLGLGIKDFLAVPARGIFQSPVGLITGMAQGTTSLFTNTVYALSNTTTQFSKAAHKIVAFTHKDMAPYRSDKRQIGVASHSHGVLNDILEGPTGLLQSIITGAEKHGLPGVFSGIALGTVGLVAKPVASILEVTGKTAQSIRNRSSLHRVHRFRTRFPRPLTRGMPLRPYSWEEAVGTLVLLEADNGKFKDEKLVLCKSLKLAGKFLTLTENVILVVRCPTLLGLGTSEFRGVPSDPEWIIEVEMSLECVVHFGREEEVLNIVGTSSETIYKQQNKRGSTSRTKGFTSTPLPLFHTSTEFKSKDEAENVFEVLQSTIDQHKKQGFGLQVFHRNNLNDKKKKIGI